MAEDNLNTSDEVSAEVGTGSAPERAEYIVGANGLFKNGKRYKEGATVELDKRTAENFLANNDIKEA